MCDSMVSLSDDIIGTIFQSTQRIVDDDSLAEMALAVGPETDELLERADEGLLLSSDLGFSLDGDLQLGMSSPGSCDSAITGRVSPLLWDSSPSPASDLTISEPPSASEGESWSPRPTKRRRESSDVTRTKRRAVGGKRPRAFNNTESTQALSNRESLDIIKQLTKTIAALPVTCIMGIVDIIHPDMDESMKDSGELVIDLSSLDMYKLARLQEFVQRELEATLSRPSSPHQRRASVASTSNNSHSSVPPHPQYAGKRPRSSALPPAPAMGAHYSSSASSNATTGKARAQQHHRERLASAETPPSPPRPSKAKPQQRGGKQIRPPQAQQKQRNSQPQAKPKPAKAKQQARQRAKQPATVDWPTSLMAQCDDDDGEIDILGI